MPTGNGAYVLHRQLEANLSGYSVRGYSPWWTLAPFTLPWFGRGGRVDLIHTHLDYGCCFKRVGIPLVATVHNYVLDAFMAPYSSFLQRLHYRTDLRWFISRTLEVADCVTAVSRFLAAKVRRDLGSTREIKVIYNGVDEQRFQPAVSAAREKGPFRILFSGNLSRRKKADAIIPLAKALGGGFEIHYTAGLAGTELPAGDAGQGKVVALGKVPYSKMPELYHAADALFMPSVREGFGLSVAEAMACGLPVVANDCSAIPELVEDGAGGFLCEIGRIDQYAEAFRRLADAPRLRRDMGAFNRARVEERFTLSRMVAEYRSLFESMR